MLYLLLKATVSGALVAVVSEAAKRSPGVGGLIASLPLISVLAMVWLWLDTRDPVRLAAQAEATFWFFLPSVPMFLIIAVLLRRGVGFWLALGVGCLVTVLLYATMAWSAPRLGLRL